MKFALRKSIWSANTTRISFFFHARGSDLEKSTIGMYSSLLLQLLEQIPALQSVFNSPRPTIWKASGHKWSEEYLKELFEQAIESLGQASLVCFIDALDKCDEGKIRDMLSFMLQIGESAVEVGIRFRVCFSSRHYPKITIDRPLFMILEAEAEHYEDIERYIAKELTIGMSGLAQQIKEEIQNRASGVFMWVVLVKKLREIPGDLQGLFHDALTRDGYNSDKLLLCVQWVLFANRPLSPMELYFAILSGTEANTASNWNPDEVTADSINLFILDTSKGLTETTTAECPRVQFIHESVRDFFLKSDGLSRVWPDLLWSNFPGRSHESIKQCCLEYIRPSMFNPKEFGELDEDKLLAASIYLESLQSPLLKYAANSVLYHAEAAEQGGIDQTGFLKSFPLVNWIFLQNQMSLNQSYYCGTKVVSKSQYTLNASLLYILAEHNAAALIKRYPENHTGFELEDELYHAPILAALACEGNAAAQALMDIKLAAEPSVPPLHDLCNRYRKDIRERIVVRRHFGNAQQIF